MDNKKRKENNEPEKKNNKKCKLDNEDIIKIAKNVRENFFNIKYGKAIEENTLSYNKINTEFNKETDEENINYDIKNRCIICNKDMGDCNPRQLCGKTICNN